MAYDIRVRIAGPRDLDALSPGELDRLADEVREAVVMRVSAGGLNGRYHPEPRILAADIADAL